MIPPQQGEQIGEGCQPFQKYSHIVDHGPSSNTNLHRFKFVATGILPFKEY